MNLTIMFVPVSDLTIRPERLVTFTAFRFFPTLLVHAFLPPARLRPDVKFHFRCRPSGRLPAAVPECLLSYIYTLTFFLHKR